MSAKKEVWMFCTHPKVKYVGVKTTWAQFQKLSVGSLSFHTEGAAAEAIRTEAEVFAARLDNWLLALRYGGRQGARYAVRAAAADGQATMQQLLTVVDEHYTE